MACPPAVMHRACSSPPPPPLPPQAPCPTRSSTTPLRTRRCLSRASQPTLWPRGLTRCAASWPENLQDAFHLGATAAWVHWPAHGLSAQAAGPVQRVLRIRETRAEFALAPPPPSPTPLHPTFPPACRPAAGSTPSWCSPPRSSTSPPSRTWSATAWCWRQTARR